MLRVLVIIAAALTLGACAIGNKVNYAETPSQITVETEKSVAVVAVEQRAYVLTGDKAPNFVGLRRGGFGNPFDVTTGSGQPFTSEVTTALVNGLKQNGIDARAVSVAPNAGPDVAMAAAKGSGAERILELSFIEWKTDIFLKMEIAYDVALRVLDAAGTQLASARVQGENEQISKDGESVFESQYARIANATLNAKLNALLNDPSVKKALK